MKVKIKDLTPRMSTTALENELIFPSSLSDENVSGLGGLRAGSRSLTHGKITIAGVDQQILLGDATDYGDGVGIFMGLDASDGLYKFRAGDPAGAQLYYNGAGFGIDGYVEDVGGQYDSAASGARVRIFPSATIGLQIIDDTASNVFIAYVSGTTVGDVILGDYAGGSGMYYDKSAGTTYFNGDVVGVSGTFGTITAGTITGVTITGSTITGSTIKTSASGARAEILASTAAYYLRDGGNDIVMTLDDSGTAIALISTDGRDLILGSDDDLLIDADSDVLLTATAGMILLDALVSGVVLSSGTDLTLISGTVTASTFYGALSGNASTATSAGSASTATTATNVSGGSVSATTGSFSSWGSFGGNVDMNDNAITELNRILWDTRSTNPSDSWALYMYDNSGYSLRTRMNGSTWTVDQTSA